MLIIMFFITKKNFLFDDDPLIGDPFKTTRAGDIGSFTLQAFCSDSKNLLHSSVNSNPGFTILVKVLINPHVKFLQSRSSFFFCLLQNKYIEIIFTKLQKKRCAKLWQN